MPAIFLSYARNDAALAQILVSDLRELGSTVWLDEETSGGQDWWNLILEQIRACEVFVYALSSASLDSLSCTRESTYAVALGKPVLPIWLAGDEPRRRLPAALATIQYVDYREQTREALARLVRALFNIPPTPPLPDPLPPAPPAPISYMHQLAELITGDAPLDAEAQRYLALELSLSLTDPALSEHARDLFTRLRNRRDLMARIATYIDVALPAPELHGRIEALEQEHLQLQKALAEAEAARQALAAERDDLLKRISKLETKPEPSLPESFTDDITGMEFVLIPAGTFEMGSNDGNDNEKPVHRVTISQPFYLGKYPVTQAQWEMVMGHNPSDFKGDANLPVESVSWDDVQNFMEKLNAKAERAIYRLPTEAEWEYAARAGTTTIYSFGDDAGLLDQYGWYNGNSENKTHPVGQLKPNPWGLYDIHGNIWEWVADWYASYLPGHQTDPTGPPNGDHRVIRGGSFDLSPGDLRSALRVRVGPEVRGRSIGFRCVRVPPSLAP